MENDKNEDPFSCFDGDSDEDNELETNVKRDEESCGILAFHPQTESSLLTYIQNNYQKGNPPQNILKSVDEYCFTRHWMMHIGPEKRNIIQSKLESSIRNFISNSNSDQFTVVELGTYCGYSAISLGLILNKEKYPNKTFKLYSFDVVPHYSSIANQLIQLAQLDNAKTIVLSEDEDPSKWCSNHGINNIDFLFLDHDKSKYTKDLISFENSKMLSKDSVVIADNVLFAGIDDFTQYAQTLETSCKVIRDTIKTNVEYCNEDVHEDAIGKLNMKLYFYQVRLICMM